ncbi:TPA: LuxR family transcriptional regulator [Pluralibacter gergoviae]|nr:LuxR family transcriptional regulator [Pluralibacter gergoviae]MBL3695567.1 LuxR family transcriptional regulator [Pluralibacter gergoviae]OUQ99968.1 hypothetical protein B5M10_14370 [Pluralibacter gergoviae]HDS1149478.1 LuxR family transcriptional regulator [Pluralibacter gergoviae]
MMKNVTTIITDDRYFRLGLTELLGQQVATEAVVIIDLDCYDENEYNRESFQGKQLVAFASDDLAYYKSEIFDNIVVLNKKSDLTAIRDFFRVKGGAERYRTRFTLSEREKQVLRMMRRGQGNKEIAESMCLSPKTTYSYRNSLMKKLGCINRIKLQELCIKNRLS